MIDRGVRYIGIIQLECVIDGRTDRERSNREVHSIAIGVRPYSGSQMTGEDGPPPLQSFCDGGPAKAARTRLIASLIDRR
jgi:hypothetical protein